MMTINLIKHDRACYNCEVEWLDDDCSIEQNRCDRCRAGKNLPYFKVSMWHLSNNQLIRDKL